MLLDSIRLGPGLSSPSSIAMPQLALGEGGLAWLSWYTVSADQDYGAVPNTLTTTHSRFCLPYFQPLGAYAPISPTVFTVEPALT